MARTSSTSSSSLSKQLLSLGNESDLSNSRNDSSSEILALFPSGGNNGLLGPSTPESSYVGDKPESPQEECIVLPQVNYEPSTDNTATLSDRNHSKVASCSSYLEQMRLCNQLDGYRDAESDMQKSRATPRNIFQYGDQRFYPDDTADSPLKNQANLQQDQGCVMSQGTESHYTYPSGVNMEDRKQCASDLDKETGVFYQRGALPEANDWEKIRPRSPNALKGNVTNEKEIHRPSKLCYRNGATFFHDKPYSQQALYHESQAGTRLRKREVSLWRPSKATIFFSTFFQDQQGQTQMDALFMNHPKGWDDDFGEQVGNQFPSEHTLATSTELNEAMRKVRALQRSQREMSNLFPHSYVPSDPFAENFNGLPHKSRFELQLKYRNILSLMKRQEFMQWEAETSSRAEKCIFSASEDTCKNPWPWRTGKFMASRRRPPKRSPAQSHQSLFLKLQKSPLVTAVSGQSENDTSLSRSRVKISDSSWSQENKQSFAFVRRELDQFNRVPKPSFQLLEGPLDISDNVGKRRSACADTVKLTLNNDNGQGDDVTSITQKYDYGDATVPRATREHGRGVPHRSPKRKTLEKRHHEKCTCTACSKSANWVHSMGFSCFSDTVEAEPMHGELKSFNAEKSDFYSTTASEVPVDASVSCAKVDHTPQKAQS